MKNKMIPSVDVAIGAAIDELVRLRPAALPHINNNKGRWAHLFEGWKAQGEIVARRFANEAKATRLFCEGEPLQQLAASEYDVQIDPTPTSSIGEVTITRSAGSLPGGVIRKGHLLFKEGDDEAQPLVIEGARYEVLEDILVPQGALTATIPFRSLRTGAGASIPRTYAGLPLIQLKFSTPIFDNNFSITDTKSAGGTQTPAADQIIRKASTASFQGKYGPTEGAIISGALLNSGVAHLAIIENWQNGRSVIFPVDESWSYSSTFNNKVGQAVIDSYRGFGCAIQMGGTLNRFIHITATVQLSDGKYLLNTTAINASIKQALTSYFNDREDWYTWKENTVKSVIASASRKIYSCSSLSISDAIDSSSVSEPSEILLDVTNPTITHYYLTDNAIDITFVGPP